MPHERTPLQIGVVVDSLTQPAWVYAALETIRDLPSARIAAVAVIPPVQRPREPILRRFYLSLDRWKYRRSSDALEPRDVSPLLSDATVVNGSESVLAVHDPDLIISFARTSNPLAARFGVWRFQHGGLAEFADETMTTEAAIVDGGGAIVERTVTGTDPISFHRGMNRLYWQSVPLLVRAIRKLSDRRAGSTMLQAAPPKETRVRIVALTARAVVRMARQKFLDRVTREQWSVAFRFRSGGGDANDDFSTFHQIVPPRDRLWADPFVVPDGNRAWIFVEEMTFAEKRGFISVIEAHRDGRWSVPQPVLRRPWHLSYPCLFRWNGEHFMLPEAAESGMVQLFRAVEFPFRWAPDIVLLDGIKAVDSTIFEHEGRWWMFLSTPSYGRVFEDLSIYHAESPRGPWVPHRLNPVLSNTIGGRGAGSVFRRDGRLFRPAQNGSRRYGFAIEIREIVELTTERLTEIPAGEVRPDWAPGLIGTHTLNVTDEVTVIDGARRRWGLKRARRGSGQKLADSTGRRTF
jgi:hypothetical protein